jgi:hypothetical protein
VKRLHAGALCALGVLACEGSKPRKPPPPEVTGAALPAERAVPAGTLEIGLVAAPGAGGTTLSLVERLGTRERRTVLDRRPGVSCDPGLANPGDVAACVADEIVYRLVRAGDALELRWARAAGGPEAVLSTVPLKGAAVRPLSPAR